GMRSRGFGVPQPRPPGLGFDRATRLLDRGETGRPRTQGGAMYKLLLCWRYLLTRYLAFACIISVMLGVATLIVVNSVMSGFSKKLKERLHGLLSDIVVESTTYDGFPGPDDKMRRIRSDPFLGPRVEAMTATMEVFAMLQYNYQGETLMRTVRV